MTIPEAQAPLPAPHSHSEIPAIELRGLTKVFGNTVAVAGINLIIPKGSFFGVVGPNGAGKTTSLNMATGLLIPDRGTALINGVDIWADPAQAKPMLGIMPDGLRLFDRLSGPALVTYFGMLRGLSKAEAEERATSLVNVLGLAEAGNKLVVDYSAGMTKKISLACALVHNPDILVLDEPFEAVDPISAATIREILNNFVSKGGTVILSSHVMETVQKLCSHVAIFSHGRVLAAGTTEQVAAGQDLDTRFAELVGGVKSTEGLEWLRH
ncbi:ABC transporter, ATP-binding protein [Gleimia coleocanis DSM 15436]|uniref:ABC transporter, ATP-binding protein n=1 Tax=Gleimia coleocanis DSM 15436 TaxID=525245 RepID=C0W0Y8_9ACTO|nr:ABC transporter ATP-binding protein [Gleimia coleocanis]EEH63712.1 ABC transporter, ATP-binding protein [Gleimia coleocanis DSM 15436]